MKFSLILTAIFISSAALGQKDFKVQFPKIDKDKNQFYAPAYKTDLYHGVEGIGNLYQPVDSITGSRYLLYDFNMDDVQFDSLTKKCLEPKNELKIIVDTNQFTLKKITFRKPFRMRRNYYFYPAHIITKVGNNIIQKTELTSDTTINVIAQPVYIANLSAETRYLKGYGFEMVVTQQAKDKNNNWQDIETPDIGGCGMLRCISVLNPNDFALTTVLRFKGNYKTKLRVKLEANNQIYYSEPFTGYIDYLQIENPAIKMIRREPYEKM